jgi:hypothetical protein
VPAAKARGTGPVKATAGLACAAAGVGCEDGPQHQQCRPDPEGDGSLGESTDQPGGRVEGWRFVAVKNPTCERFQPPAPAEVDDDPGTAFGPWSRRLERPPPPPEDKLVVQVAEVRDRAAEREAAQPQEGTARLEPRAGAGAAVERGFGPVMVCTGGVSRRRREIEKRDGTAGATGVPGPALGPKKSRVGPCRTGLGLSGTAGLGRDILVGQVGDHRAELAGLRQPLAHRGIALGGVHELRQPFGG